MCTAEDVDINIERALNAKTISVVDRGVGVCMAREFGVASKLVGRERFAGCTAKESAAVTGLLQECEAT